MTAAKNQSRAPHIATVLRQRVVSGEWKPHQQIQTEHQLAREFGVSRGTVIRSLRELEREGLIWSRRGEGRYVADPSARPRTNTIGAIVLDMTLLSHPVRATELGGIRDACVETDYHLQIFAFNTATTSGPPAAQADAWLQQIDPMRLDGLIIAHWGVPDERVIELSRRVPIVWESRAKISQRIGGTLHDHTGAAMDAVEHLLELGHRDIALVTIEEMRNQGWQQREGARLGMRMVTKSGDARLHVITARNNRSEDWLPSFRELLLHRREHRPTAVIFGSDDLAVNGFKIISDLKLEIPKDLSVISTNDTLTPPTVPVPLTSIRFDYKELGMLSTRLLLRMIADPQAEHSTVILPGELIVRESTAAPSGV